MKFAVKETVKHNVIVWTHEEMDKLRKSQCMCLNCGRLKTERCGTADCLFETCKVTNIALAVTRCPAWYPHVEDSAQEKEQL